MSKIYPIGIQNFEKIRRDGYFYVDKTALIYQMAKTGSYWFETGTPTYLVELLKSHHYDLHCMTEVETDAEILNSVDSASTNPIPVIYQSGYLTIKEYDERFGIYRLGFPNREVEEGFMKFLLPFFYADTNNEISRNGLLNN